MSEPIETMREMVQVSKFLGGLPGVDGDRIDRQGADKMRETVAGSLSSVVDDCTEGEMYELIRAQEDEMLTSDNVDTSDMTEGEARMLCQIALVRGIMEES